MNNVTKMLLSKIVLTYLKGRKGIPPKQILFQTINSTCIVKNGLQNRVQRFEPTERSEGARDPAQRESNPLLTSI